MKVTTLHWAAFNSILGHTRPVVHGWLAWKEEPCLGNSVKKRGLEHAQETMSMKKWGSKHLEHRSPQPSRNSGALKLTSLPKLQSAWDESSDSPLSVPWGWSTWVLVLEKSWKFKPRLQILQLLSSWGIVQGEIAVDKGVGATPMNAASQCGKASGNRQRQKS